VVSAATPRVRCLGWNVTYHSRLTKDCDARAETGQQSPTHPHANTRPASDNPAEWQKSALRNLPCQGEGDVRKGRLKMDVYLEKLSA
jgi:hypothetical protein